MAIQQLHGQIGIYRADPITLADGQSAALALTEDGKLQVDSNVTINSSVLGADVFELSESDALATAIVDGDGNQITSFGGGTQYTDGGTPPANPVGPTLLWNDDGTWKSVSDVNPLPTTASVDTTGLALAANQLPDGHNVTVDNASIAVTGTFWQATQPVSGTVSITTNSAVNVAQMNGVATTMGNGTSGTGVQRVTIASDSTGQIIARGAAAHGATVSGNPILNGAEARTSEPPTVSSGQTVRLQATTTGKLVVHPYALPQNMSSGRATSTGTSNTQLLFAPGAGSRWYITSIIISNSSDTDTEVDIKDGTTIIATYPAPAKSGAVHSFPMPLRQPSTNAVVNFASLDAVTTMKVTAVGYFSV